MTVTTAPEPRVSAEPVSGTQFWAATRLVAEREVRTFLRMKGFWIGLAVIIVGGSLTLLVLAIVTTAWWILSEVEHRVERVKRNDAEMAAAEKSN